MFLKIKFVDNGRGVLVILLVIDEHFSLGNIGVGRLNHTALVLGLLQVYEWDELGLLLNYLTFHFVKASVKYLLTSCASLVLGNGVVFEGFQFVSLLSLLYIRQ